MSMRSTLELFLAGHAALQAAHAAEEKTKLGVLRAGNTGVLDHKGNPVGSCARKAYLRMVGVEVDPPDATKSLMFDAGNGNEDLWVRVLEAANEPGLVLKREEELGLEWFLADGRKVSGRPDIVLGSLAPSSSPSGSEPVFVPERGIELKLVSSLWTARDVLFKGKPKTVHLMQAGHYAWKMGIPFEIWYASRTNFAITDYSESRFFARKNFPKQGEPLSEYCSFNEQGQILGIEPFIVGYRCEWNSKGQLMYTPIREGGEAVATFITQKGIEDYYSLISAAEKEDKLMPRPVNKEADGERGGFDLCMARYCVLSGVCDRHEKSTLTAWLKDVKVSV